LGAVYRVDIYQETVTVAAPDSVGLDFPHWAMKKAVSIHRHQNLRSIDAKSSPHLFGKTGFRQNIF